MTIEEGSIGGFASHVLQFLAPRRADRRRGEGPPDGSADVWMDQAKPEAMYAKAGLDRAGIVRTVFEALGTAHLTQRA